MSKHSKEDTVDSTLDPAGASRGLAADSGQTAHERDEAIHEFDTHLDGSGDKPGLPTPQPTSHDGNERDPKSTTRTE